MSFGFKNPVVEIVSKYSEVKFHVAFNAIETPPDFYIVVDDKHVKTRNAAIAWYACGGPKFNLGKLPPDRSLPGGRRLHQHASISTPVDQ